MTYMILKWYHDYGSTWILLSGNTGFVCTLWAFYCCTHSFLCTKFPKHLRNYSAKPAEGKRKSVVVSSCCCFNYFICVCACVFSSESDETISPQTAHMLVIVWSGRQFYLSIQDKTEKVALEPKWESVRKVRKCPAVNTDASDILDVKFLGMELSCRWEILLLTK